MVVVAKEDLKVVADFQVEGFSLYHFSNAWDEGAGLKVHVNKLIGPREGLEKNFKNMYDAEFSRQTYNEIYEMTIDLSGSGKCTSFEPVCKNMLPMEFPKVAPSVMSRRARYTYSNGWSGRATYMDCLQRYDADSETVEFHPSEPNRYPSEAEVVPKQGGVSEDDVYIVYHEYDATTHTSDIVVVDGKDFSGPAVCRIHLPHHIPYSFHGCVIQQGQWV